MNKTFFDGATAVVASAALVVAFWSYGTSKEDAAGAARAEVAGYATQVVQLDYRADERSDTSITVLVEQADAVIEQYGQGRLHLPPSTYRVLAQYADLDTENRPLAQKFADAALAAAIRDGNSIEEIRSYRVLGDIDAGEGDLKGLDVNVRKSLNVANDKNQPIAVRGSVTFTQAFAVYDALWAARVHHSCDAAKGYFKEFYRSIEDVIKAESLEASRRAYRLRTSYVCGLNQEKLGISTLIKVWMNNPERQP